MAATDRLERLINLVIALRQTRVPLTTAQIRERVAGYDQPDDEAFRRMFERDKADLRALGVPVDTEPVDPWGDRVGYRIDPARYDLPELALDPDEIAALAVALEATGLADEAGGGLRKIEVDSDRPGVSRGAQTRMDVVLDAPHRSVLLEAQVSRTVVRFGYRAADGSVSDRTIDPHGLVHRSGRWYVVGRDHDRAARRAFRLDRMQTGPRTVGEPGAFPPPEEGVSVADVLPRPEGGPGSAVVDVSPELAWQVARGARGAGEEQPDGWVRFRVPAADPEAFIAWALQQGPLVEVVEPAALRQEIAAHLGRLASMERA